MNTVMQRHRWALVLTAAAAAGVLALSIAPSLNAQGRMGDMMGGGQGGMGMGRGMGGMMGAPRSLGTNPLPASPEVLAKGKALYDANCAACHGPAGHGDGAAAPALKTPPPDLRGMSTRWSDGQIAAQIRDGSGQMPPNKDALDANAIWSIVHYVRTLQH